MFLRRPSPRLASRWGVGLPGVRRPATLVAGLLLAVPSTGAAAAGSWTDVPLPGAPGVVQTIALDPSTPTTVYAGTAAGGVFKSIDGGVSWAPSNGGLGSLDVQALAIDPNSPATIYAGTFDAGVYKTVDGGAQWSPASAGLTAADVSVLAFRPGTASTIYAGTDSGVFKTTDSASSWAPVNNGLAVPDVRAIAVSPSAPDTVFAGTFPASPADRGVFRSIDGGGLWAAVGPVSGAPASKVLSLALRSGAPETLYVAGDATPVLSSTNGGATWDSLPTSSALTVTSLIPDAERRAIFAATIGSGVIRITDAPRSVTAMPMRILVAGLADLNMTAMGATADAGTLVAGTASGSVATLTVPVADLAVGVRQAGSGYTYTVTNLGPQPAPQVWLGAPSSFIDLKVTPSQGACSAFAGCELGSLVAGQSATVSVTAGARLPAPGATVGGLVRDTNAANDVASLPPPVPPTPVTPTAAPPPPAVTSKASSLRAACVRRPPIRVKLKGRVVKRAVPCRIRLAFRVTRTVATTISFQPEAGGKRTLAFTRLARAGLNSVVVADRLRRRFRPGRYLVSVRPLDSGGPFAGTGVFLTIPSR